MGPIWARSGVDLGSTWTPGRWPKMNRGMSDGTPLGVHLGPIVGPRGISPRIPWDPKGPQGTPENANESQNILRSPGEPQEIPLNPTPPRESQEILRILQDPTESNLGNPWISVDIYGEPRGLQKILRKTGIVGKLRKFRESETIPGNRWNI